MLEIDPRMNRPRVFLSHSKSDVEFVERLDADLRNCQIDTWLDSVDIPHGRPWLDAIFEDGIPGCDAVLVYVTDASLESSMVKKEIDAAILGQLQDRRVAFLPYVSSPEVRKRLRYDLQALQTPVWVQDNYQTLLPRVVAEIWRSYLERTVATAVQEEKVRRLQAELDLETAHARAADSVFTPAEEAEFGHIWRALDRLASFEVEERVQLPGQKALASSRRLKVGVQLTTLVPMLIASGYDYSFQDAHAALREPASAFLSEKLAGSDEHREFSIELAPQITDELVMYGLLERVHDSQPRDSSSHMPRMLFNSGPDYWNVWTAKSQRLRYWLAYNDKLPDVLAFSGVEDLSA